MIPDSYRGSLVWTLFPQKKSYSIETRTDGVYYISRDFSTNPNIYTT